jgi:hypothetical protein
MREWKACRGSAPDARLTASVPQDPFRHRFVHRQRDSDARTGKTVYLSYFVNQIYHF